MRAAKLLKEASNLKQPFTRKIKSVEQIKKIIGSRPRKKKVVMCHGTFDIVHPGHIRQLIYAKSKGDILVVSIVIDQYVAKRPISPYVPQELRAINLAAFEIVDYVLIDKNSKPLKNILKLQPDFFVKGFEYSLNGIHPKTKEEIATLNTYGGKMIFSPGDIVYSSSKLLTTQRPNLSLDQLLVFMRDEKITFDMLRTTIKKFAKTKIHVIGDVILDKYSSCTILGPASGSTAFSVRLDNTKNFVGGAGVVAKHLKQLGADVTLTTVLGDDDSAKFVTEDLKTAGVKLNAIVDSSRPTTVKQRFMAINNQKLIQVDTVDNSMISNGILKQFSKHLKNTKTDAVVCSDFRHGIFNSNTISKITRSIPKSSLKIADSQVSNRWGNILDFKHFDLVTPNEKEARFALADQETTIRPLAQKLYNKAKCRYLILKLGENGLITYRSPGMDVREYFYIDTFADEVIDDVGAGDALLSTATLGLAASADIVQASILGNLCAAFECSKMGNVPVTKNELVEMVSRLENKF